jgi:hypothetical protein
MPFEINNPFGSLLTGSIDAAIQQIGGVAPSTILEVSKDAKVHVTWTLDGLLTQFVAGTWYVSAFLELMGPGTDLRLPLVPGKAVPLTPQVGPVSYATDLDIPAGTITLNPDEDTRAYKLVVTLTYRSPSNHPGPMAGFVDGTVIQFYAD